MAAAGASAVARSAPGAMPVGLSTVGASAVARSAPGAMPVGLSTVGVSAVARSAPGALAAGLSALGASALATSAVARSAPGALPAGMSAVAMAAVARSVPGALPAGLAAPGAWAVEPSARAAHPRCAGSARARPRPGGTCRGWAGGRARARRRSRARRRRPRPGGADSGRARGAAWRCAGRGRADRRPCGDRSLPPDCAKDTKLPHDRSGFIRRPLRTTPPAQHCSALLSTAQRRSGLLSRASHSLSRAQGRSGYGPSLRIRS